MLYTADGSELHDAQAARGHKPLRRCSALLAGMRAEPIASCTAPSVCALQGELALVYGHSDEFILGSCSATTCAVVIVAPAEHDTSRFPFAVAHLDEGTACVAAIAQILPSAPARRTVTMHILGAFDDEQGTGKKVLDDTLNALIAHTDVDVVLETLFAQDLNTQQLVMQRGVAHSAPVHTAFAINTRSRLVFPADFTGVRGPAVAQRMARSWLPSPGIVALDPLGQVFDPDLNLYHIGRVDMTALRNQDYCLALQNLLWLPEEQFLQLVSTSPLVEPPGFVTDVRNAIEWLLARRDLNFADSLEFDLDTRLTALDPPRRTLPPS